MDCNPKTLRRYYIQQLSAEWNIQHFKIILRNNLQKMAAENNAENNTSIVQKILSRCFATKRLCKME